MGIPREGEITDPELLKILLREVCNDFSTKFLQSGADVARPLVVPKETIQSVEDTTTASAHDQLVRVEARHSNSNLVPKRKSRSKMMRGEI